MDNNVFHLGLCMAGSVSAGAYTAGVMDYLMEALERWEAVREKDSSVPNHRVEIDLFGGSSGGGITAAMALFAFWDTIQHASLNEDGRTYDIDADKNIFWKIWVEQTRSDVFSEMLKPGDIDNYHIPSAMNASFIDKIAHSFEQYVHMLKSKLEKSGISKAPFLSKEVELFMTLFNVTGMKYQLNSRANAATEQYVSEHRDLAHFKWGGDYEGQGRLEVAFHALHNLPVLIQSCKATGAFPVGLKARIVERKAKYIWDNPFFQKNGKFNQSNISLGEQVKGGEDIYMSLNADGGTSNNEPVELVRSLMLQIRMKEQDKVQQLEHFGQMDDTEKMVEKSKLTNYSVILVDPFPSYNFDIEAPTDKSNHILTYCFDLVFAMNSQLQFDAKEAIEAYDKNNYGLHIIAPSRSGAERPEYAIACGALGGFGGFLSKEYRIHDYFLGRHNCQSFIRKYFVVDPNEKEQENGKPNENYDCIKAVLEGYKNEQTRKRFGFVDENGKEWVPIIPDVTLTAPIKIKEVKVEGTAKTVIYEEPSRLPLYRMELPPADFLEKYREGLKSRINTILNNVYDSSWIGDLIINIAAMSLDDTIADIVIKAIRDDLNKRSLISIDKYLYR